MNKIAFLILLIILSPSYLKAENNITYETAEKKLSLQWELNQNVGYTYERSLGSQITAIWKKSKKCFDNQSIKEISIIVEIDEAGDVTNVLANKSGELKNCIRDIILERNFLAPPFAPFYMRIRMH